MASVEGTSVPETGGVGGAQGAKQGSGAPDPRYEGVIEIALPYRAPDGSTKRLSEGVEWDREYKMGFLEWEAEPGEYELSAGP